MTSSELQQAYIEQVKRMEAHSARRDRRYHATQRVDETLGNRIVADKHVLRSKGEAK